MDSLPHAVSLAPLASVDGTWHRHVALRYARRGLDGVNGRSRWGTPEGFPILYLGSPTKSVIVEAYRHLVDPVDAEMITEIQPRMLLTCVVGVTNILDLREANARMITGLSIDTLTSPTRDREAYQRCQQVAAVAHQLGLHGLITRRPPRSATPSRYLRRIFPIVNGRSEQLRNLDAATARSAWPRPRTVACRPTPEGLIPPGSRSIQAESHHRRTGGAKPSPLRSIVIWIVHAIQIIRTSLTAWVIRGAPHLSVRDPTAPPSLRKRRLC